ncbi:solute carrier family 22 member 18 isoform X10 [Lagenorhynchus albirostris]|uniref:solute carrier family 22 member 18 isoform X10 n=1 Tax=Lagenorhynchus albirostris TaxID=27610 RepID=UPI0028E788D6|nr:solute carrier family 22 member 18 isoform X10 [Lagenorhynchus albirostris]
MGYRCARNGGLRDDTADLDLSPWKGGSINGGAEELVLEGDRESVLDVLSSSTCPGGWAWTLLPSATSRPSLACFSCWAGPCLAGSQTSAGRGQRSRSPSWRPQRSTCSWLPPAARPCPACPYSLPRACPAPSCTRCQVGPAAQMAITDLSAPEERPAALGRLGLCFGVGVIFGSLLGGTLSSTCGIQCPVIVALVVSLLGAVLSLTCLPTSTKGASARAQSALPGKPKASVFDLKAITCLLLQPGVLPVFLVKVICGFPSGLFMVMFSLISMDFFQLEAAQAGYLMSFFGVLQMEPCWASAPLCSHWPEPWGPPWEASCTTASQSPFSATCSSPSTSSSCWSSGGSLCPQRWTKPGDRGPQAQTGNKLP